MKFNFALADESWRKTSQRAAVALSGTQAAAEGTLGFSWAQTQLERFEHIERLERFKLFKSFKP
jgi:hypothetical protein